MRRRGVIFKDFKSVDTTGSTTTDIIKALDVINSNLKLVLEILADLRVNTSEDPKKQEKEDKK
ncbi:MAG: hypothetical protein DRO67_01935 [Candidatus Asgardarchaeum californiense]|nr:MAG: hypothetical protein DRO67_01935 [Candidatus Asgardarchaeum californiense]